MTEVLAALPEITKHLDAREIQSLDDPQQYLGSAEMFRQRQLAAELQVSPTKEKKE